MKTKLKYIWFTWDGCGLTIARKLLEEGNTVIVGQVQDKKELGLPNDRPEEPEDKKHRLSLFDGMLKKHDAKELIKKMNNIENKNDYFVVFDFNNLWKYGEIVAKMGFDNIFYPTKEQWELEEDRNKGKEFVKEHYPNLKVAQVQEFKTIDEGIEFLEDTEDVWVLKSYSPDGSTVVPMSEEPEAAAEEIVGALKLEQKDYEKLGFILEQKIPDPIEVTPEAQFFNGKLLMTTVDIENKPIGAGSSGPMTGCSSNLIIKTEYKDKINKIVFPPIIHEMAKKHKGLFVWDGSVLIEKKTQDLYFGEFCANRWGWDSFFTNLSMCNSVSDFFESMVKGKNPLKNKYGAAVRMFNLKKDMEVPIITDNDKEVYYYDAKMKDGKVVSAGTGWDLLVCTGADNDLEVAVDKAYDVLHSTNFTNGYYRPKFDFISTDYNNSIINRLDVMDEIFGEVDLNKKTDDLGREIKKLLNDE